MLTARSIAIGTTLALFVLTAVACSTPEPPKPPGSVAEVIPYELSGAPEWVKKSCENYWDDDDDAHLCAVGAVAGTRATSLARTAAIARARTALARSIETTVQGLLKDYQATSTGGEDFGSLASDEQYITDTSKQITDISLAGTKFQNSWVAPSGTMWVLVSLDLSTFEEALKRDMSLPESERTAIAERAKEAFAELKTEIEEQVQ